MLSLVDQIQDFVGLFKLYRTVVVELQAYFGQRQFRKVFVITSAISVMVVHGRLIGKVCRGAIGREGSVLSFLAVVMGDV